MEVMKQHDNVHFENIWKIFVLWELQNDHTSSAK